MTIRGEGPAAVFNQDVSRASDVLCLERLGERRGPAEIAAGPVVGQAGVELGQRLIDDLADALAADLHLVGDLLERERLAPVQPEAEAQDPGLALVDGLHQAAES